MSIAGSQEKFSLILEKNKLRLAKSGESGHYLLKPIPLLGKNKHLMPANEHLTMQIAKQVFQIGTPQPLLRPLFYRTNGGARQRSELGSSRRRYLFHLAGEVRAGRGEEGCPAVPQRTQTSEPEGGL